MHICLALLRSRACGAPRSERQSMHGHSGRMMSTQSALFGKSSALFRWCEVSHFFDVRPPSFPKDYLSLQTTTVVCRS